MTSDLETVCIEAQQTANRYLELLTELSEMLHNPPEARNTIIDVCMALDQSHADAQKSKETLDRIINAVKKSASWNDLFSASE